MRSRPPKTHSFPAARVLETPIGRVQLGAAEDGLALLLFPNSPDTILAGEPASVQAEAHLDAACDALNDYFAGRRTAFDDLPLVPHGTRFQKSVWSALTRIPFGATRTYRDIAVAIGNPKAVRAVGLANGQNPP